MSDMAINGNQIYRLPGQCENDVIDPETGVVVGKTATMRVGTAVVDRLNTVPDTTGARVRVDDEYLARLAHQTLARLYGLDFPEAPAGDGMSSGARLGGG